jgi:hypothetical protein
MMRRAPLATLALTILTPGFAFADVFDWTYGGGTDPVYAWGTVTAVQDGSQWDITGGSGTRVVSAPLPDPGTYAVTIVAFPPDPQQGPIPISGSCVYSLASTCDIHDAGTGGVTADLIFDNVLFANAAPGYQLDPDGIVLYEADGPHSQYFSVWSSSSSAAVPPDQEFDPYYYQGTNLTNPFTVTPVPEPTSYVLVGLSLLGFIALKLRAT